MCSTPGSVCYVRACFSLIREKAETVGGSTSENVV